MAGPTVVELEKARDLIDYVSPLNKHWNEGQYIFRGQPNDEYQLIPSVCRTGEGSFGYGHPMRVFGRSSAGQIRYELDLVRRFLEGCDRSGLIVPGDTEQIRDRLNLAKHTFMQPESPWPQQEVHQILAVAQHYDVPTRLLDWTDRSFVACYFAASSANFEIDYMGMPKIAIWALETSHSRLWETIKIIRPPGGTSRNQAAQSGLFTAHQMKAYSIHDDYKPQGLEQVSEIYDLSNGHRSLIKITLPLSESPALLTFCSKLGVDGATLFPGFSGVARTVKDWINIEIGVRHSDSAIQDHMQSYYQDD